MATERIKFNIDYGISLKPKDIEKDLEKNKDLVKRMIEGEDVKVKININPETAIDDKGNPIDKATLKQFEKKAEKQINDTIKVLFDNLGKDMSDAMSKEIAKTVTSEIKTVFAEMSAAIIDSIHDMKKDIEASLKGSVKIDVSDSIKIDDSELSKQVDSSVKTTKKETQKIVDSYNQAKIKLENAKKNFNKALDKLNNQERDIEINGFTYSKESIAKIQKDGNTLNNTVKKLAAEFKKVNDEYFNIDTDDDSDEIQQLTASLEKKQKDIANVIHRLNNYDEKLLDNVFGKEDEDVLYDFKSYIDTTLKAQVDYAKKAVSDAQKEVNEIESQSEFTALNLGQSSIKTDGENSNVKIKVEPSINANRFIKQVVNAVEAIEKNLPPVEVPIKADGEYVGEFIEDIREILSKNPVQIALDKTDFVNQIQDSVKNIDINISGNLTNVTTNSSNVVPTPSVNQTDSDDFFDDDYFEYLESLSQAPISADFLSNLKSQLSGATEETENISDNFEQIISNLDTTAKKVEVVRETAKQTSNILVGEVEIFETDPEIEILKEKIQAYEIIADLRKKNIGIKKEQRTLEKKANKTDEEKSRLNALKEERAQRIAIKNEWKTFAPILEKINQANSNIYDNEKKLNDLSTLEEKQNLGEKLTKQEMLRLEILKGNKKQSEEELDTARRMLESGKQELEILRKQSKYFGQMQDRSLLEFQKDVVGNRSAKVLIGKANDDITNIRNKSVGSQEYSNAYSESIKKQDNALKNTLRKLVETDELWQDINASVQEKGKEKALEEVNSKLNITKKRLEEISKQKIVVDSKHKNGTYTSQKYNEEMDLLLKDEDVLKAQKRSEQHRANILKNYSEEEIARISTENHQKRELYNEDLKTQVGRNKRLNELRYEDLTSFKQYNDEYNNQINRRNKNKSYNQQINAYESELISSGVSVEDAKRRKYEIVKDTDYYSNKNALEKYNTQIKNLELDLNEIIRLMKEINELNEKLSVEGITEYQSNDLKNRLSDKASSLETIISRTGWQSYDIKQYQKYKEFLEKNNKDSSLVQRNANLDKFKKDAKSIQDIVDNINNELTIAEKENKELIAGVEQSERLLKEVKEKITLKHQGDAQRTLEVIKQLSDERQRLNEEIKKSNDANEIASKQSDVDVINGKLRKLEYRYNIEKNPVRLQVNIDEEFDRETKKVQESIATRKSQISYNNEYIKSLQQMKDEQEELRKKEEPTSKELTSEKRKVNTQYKKDVQEINTTIQNLEEELSKAQSQLASVSHATSKALEKINAELDEETTKLSTLNNIDKLPSYDSKHSSIYQEYLDTQKSIEDKMANDNKQIIDNDKKKKQLQQNLNDVLKQYGVENEEQLKTEIQKRNVFKEILSLQEDIYKLSKKEKLREKDVEDMLNKKVQLSKITSRLGFTSTDIDEFKTLNNEVDYLTRKIDYHDRTMLIERLESDINARLAKGEDSDDLKKLVKRFNELVAKDKNEQEIAALNLKLAEKQSQLSSVINKIGKENAQYYRTTSVATNYIGQIDDYERDKNLIVELKKENELLRSSIDSDAKKLHENRNDYVSNLSQGLLEEVKAYNDEIIKSGELTEKAENHLLNMVRYMDELENISGEAITFSDYGIDSKTFNKMSQILKENQEMDSNIAKSEANYEEKQQQKIKAQEKIVASLKKQKEEQEHAIYIAQKEVEQKQKALDLATKERAEIEETHNLEVAAIDERRKAMKKATASSKIKEELVETSQEVQKTETELARLVQYWNNVNKNKIRKGSEVNENAAYFNVQSGQITQYVEGEAEHLSQELIDSVVNSAKIAIDGAIHTHGDWNKAAFSVGDLKTAYNDVLRGIKTQILMSMDEVMTLDLNGVKGYDLADIISEYEVRANEAKERLTKEGISDIDTLQVEFQNILKELFDAKGLSKHLQLVSVKDYLKANKPVDSDFKPTMFKGNQTPLSSNSEYSDKDIVFETDAIINSQKELGDVAEETSAILDEQAKLETTTLPQSPIVEQQKEAREEIVKTNEELKEQIELAIKNAQISIAEGSYVNIAGDIRIDENQWSGVESLSESAEKLLTVVQNIFAVISNGTPQVVSDINAIQTPINNITTDMQTVGNVISDTNVQLKSFGNNIKAVSAGNIDIKSKEFKDIQVAVEAMNVALKKSKTLSKIKDSGDITASYFVREEEDEQGNVISKPFVKLNTVFKDTNGQIIKARYEYDVLAKKITDVSNITAKVADGFSQQEKAMKNATTQLTYHTNKLDKIKVKYQTFNINDFGIDDDGKLFAKVGTHAEQIYDIITGKTKELIKNVINDMNKVETKFIDLKQKSESGILSQEAFEKLSSDLNLLIETLDTSMNAVNRHINTQLEHTSRNLLSSWQRELADVNSYMYDDTGNVRIDTSNLNERGLQYIKDYQVELAILQSLYKQMQDQGENFTQEQINAWKIQKQNLLDLKKLINSNSSKIYVNDKGFSLDGYSMSSDEFARLSADSSYARQVLSSLAQEINNTDIEVIKLSKDNHTLTYSFKDQNKNIHTCKLSVEDYGETIRNTNVNSAKHVGLLSKAFNSLKDKLLQIFKYVSAYEIFYKVVNAIRDGVEIVKELDSAMTEMKKVTHDSDEALQSFARSSHKVAQEIGTTSSIIQNSAADWMRLGYSINEAAELAKNTSILMNVSEFEDIGTATESMVAMIQAFKTEGTDVVKLSEELIDKLNNIGNNYSISTSELAESLKRSSGTLIAANNSVDEAIALTTAGNAIIQDAEATGNALKVISMRIRGTTVEALEAEGEDTEGLVETTSKLQEEVKALTSINGQLGVSLTDVNGNYRSTYEILQDIADIWDEIGQQDVLDGQNRQAALLELLAGKTRAQSLASLLQNADMLRSVYEDVQKSEGSAAKENAAYMESIEAHIQVLKAKWQELWDDSLSREQINWVIDRLGDIVDIVKEIGLGWSAAIVGAGIFGVNSALKGGGRAKKLSK